MSVGYACIALGTCDRGMRGCILKNASPERLEELVESNLQTLSRLLDYNAARGIKLFRISSDIIPGGTNTLIILPNWAIKSETRTFGYRCIRVSMRC